jgi:hypothetical protein
MKVPPALIDLKRRPPDTSVGALLLVEVPSPSWPELLVPQHHAVEVVVIPQV